MKNSCSFAVLVSVMACSSAEPGAPDARVAAADLALRDIASEPLTDTPYIADVLVADITPPDTAPIRPAVGRYAAHSEHYALSGATWDRLISPLDREGFFVYKELDKDAYWIVFSINGKRYGDIPIIDGHFHYARGNILGVTDCPEDGYAIDGSFISETKVQGEFSAFGLCYRNNGGGYVAERVEETPSDSGIIDTAPFVPNIGLDAYVPDAPPVYEPVPGHYTARLVPDSTGASTNSIYPLDAIGLTVRKDEATGNVTIFFFSAVDTNGIIPVIDGKIDFVHGRGGTDGTVCPANGYAINGTFVSPTELRGAYASINFCSLLNSGNYIATLDVPGPEPPPEPIDAGAIVDSSTQ